MSLTIKYLDTPDGAQSAATTTGTNLQPFDTSMETGADDVAWATLETGVWVLDGTREILPDNPKNVGWWSSAVSTEYDQFILGESILGWTALGGYASRTAVKEPGTFETPPTITVDLSERFTATGITLIFSPSTEQWCTSINIQWYRGETLLAEISAEPDSSKWEGGDSVDGFNRIVITLYSTNVPGHMAKLQQIIVGQTIVFGPGEIVSVHLVNEADSSLGRLSVDTSRFELTAPNDLNLVPQEDQRMELYKNDELLAVHYIESGSREANETYTFNCRSAIGMLTAEYMGGVYKNVLVSTLLADILGDRRFELAGEFASTVVSGYLPICTQREALQQVALAIGAVVSTFGTDSIKIAPAGWDTIVTFTGDDIFPGATTKTAQRIAKFRVTAHNYTASKTAETILEDEDVDGTDVLFTFDEPHHSYSITGGTITGSGANWITVTAAGVVTVTAKPYVHTTSTRTMVNPNATFAERSNVMSITDATLVTKSNVAGVLNRLYTSGQWRQTLEIDAAITNQRAGMLAIAENIWGTHTRGAITAMESDLTQNGHTARVTIIGEEV